jgi:hypothetical protein
MPARVLPHSSRVAYDAGRQRIVLYEPYTGQTWERTRAVWGPRTIAAGPTSDGLLAYYAPAQRVVLLASADTWEWDGQTWTRRSPPVAMPARDGTAMEHYPPAGRLVLFGGRAKTAPYPLLADTWEWDGTSWIQRAPAMSPPARENHQLAYDSRTQRLVLFGGYGSVRLADTWEWDGTTWAQRSPATSPPARSGHAMGIDATDGRVILFGGGGGSAGLLSDTWKWDGTTWLRQAPVKAPPRRSKSSLVTDTARQRTVLVGGTTVNGGSLVNDTWEWDGAEWTEIASAVGPSARGEGLGAAYDTARARIVLFGGHGAEMMGDTWEWDGERWWERRPTGAPLARHGLGMAYDAARQRTVLFAGATGVNPPLSDTWEWDGNSWAQRFPAAAPSRRMGHAMAYDAARQRVLLFGGYTGYGGYLADTWEWDGTTWTQLTPATSPIARSSHGLAYDATRQRVVLFGGGYVSGSQAYYLQDTWEWDGTSWLQRTPASSPLPRYEHQLAYDATTRTVVLHGGVYHNGSTFVLHTDTWEWDGTTWTRRSTATNPGGSTGFAMAHHGASGRTLLHGNAGTWLHGPVLRGAATPFGQGCAGTRGLPVLTSNEPFLGNLGFGLDVLSAALNAPCVFALSDGTQSLAVGGGCTFYLTNVLAPSIALTNATGFASAVYGLPFDPTLRGILLYAQAFVVDARGGFAGLAFSAGRRLVLGD